MKKTITYIDDERDILEAVQIILESHGYNVKTHTHMNSLDELIDEKPNLILLDILLVGGSGKDICAQIKQHPHLQHIPVIMISAHPLSKLKTVTQQSGADGYLQKPFELDTLVQTVEKHLHTHGEPTFV